MFFFGGGERGDSYIDVINFYILLGSWCFGCKKAYNYVNH